MPYCVLEERDGAHWYRTEYGLHPSVTTILSATADSPEEAPPGTAAAAVHSYIRDRAAAIGSHVHRLNEEYMSRRFGLEPPEPYRDERDALIADAHHRNFRPFLDSVSDAAAVEQSVASPRMDVAGTIDCVGYYNGERSIIDYKTKRWRQNESTVHDALLQASLYARLWNDNVGPLYPVTRVIVAVSTEYGTLELYGAPADRHVDEAIARVVMFHEMRAGRVPAVLRRG